jgi:hypothetical protein
MAKRKKPALLGGEEPIELDVVAMPEAVFDVLGCAMDYSCTKTWRELVPTADPRTRTCLDCKSPVTLCTDQNSLDRLATGGQCVAYLSQEGNSVRTIMGLPSRGKLRAFLDEL